MIRKIFFVLPSFNEEENLLNLSKKLINFFENKNLNIVVVVIDDGSTDSTIILINNLIKKKYKRITFKLLSHKKNMGLGMALKTGFEYCFNNGNSNDVIITMDADSSHTIEQSYEMLKKIIYNKKDIVIASRFVKNSKISGLNHSRKSLSLIAAVLYKFFFPIKNVQDYTSGFRSFKLKKIREIFYRTKNFFSESGFSASADILLKLYPYKNEISFYEIPINLRYDLKLGNSKMKVLKTIYLNLRLILIRRFGLIFNKCNIIK